MITKAQYDLLVKIAATGKDGFKPDMTDYETSNMIGYFEMCGFISTTATSIRTYVILPLGEIAITEYENTQRQSEESRKALAITSRAATFAGLSLLATVILGVLNLLLR